MMGHGSSSVSLPKWRKYTVTFNDISIANAVKTQTILALAAKEIVHAAITKTSTAFAGGTTVALAMTLGVAGAVTKYLTAYACVTAVSDTQVLGLGVVNPNPESYATPTNIIATFTNTGDTNDHLTQGSVDIWLLISAMP